MASLRPYFATLHSRLSSTILVPTLLPLTSASFRKRRHSLHLLLLSSLSNSSKRLCSLNLSQFKKM